MRQTNKIFYRKIQLPLKIKKSVLAVGSQVKNTVCFAKNNSAYLSPVHADLSHPRDFLSFEKTARYFLKKHPKIIAYDLHPEYQSTKYAQHLSVSNFRLLAVQHHHAHIASCMTDNGLKNQKVIGVAFDGTGFGSDNTIWGAEFLVCDYRDFKRRAHLKEIPLLGGEKAIQEPWRLTALWLYRIYKDRFLNLDLEFIKKIDKNKWRVLKNMYLIGLNSPSVSSMGRLFDAAASLILANHRANFEGELAMGLERVAGGYKLGVRSYKFKIIEDKNQYVIDPAPIFKEMVADLKARQAREKIAYRFHFTMAQIIKKICLILRKETKINKTVLSGGVFQNRLLLKLAFGLLYREGFAVFTHKNLSSNDSSISLGQALIASFRS